MFMVVLVLMRVVMVVVMIAAWTVGMFVRMWLACCLETGFLRFCSALFAAEFALLFWILRGSISLLIPKVSNGKVERKGKKRKGKAYLMPRPHRPKTIKEPHILKQIRIQPKPGRMRKHSHRKENQAYNRHDEEQAQ